VSERLEWIVLEAPPQGELIEIWTVRPDNSWMQTIGVLSSDEDDEPLMRFDDVEHMQFHDEPPDNVARFSGRMWKYK
jgi:hypothetical protein